VTFPPSVRSWFEQALGLIVVFALLLGPPLWALLEVINGGPLYATRTVQKPVTEIYGIVPEVAPVLSLWALVLFIGWGMATGAFPRMR